MNGFPVPQHVGNFFRLARTVIVIFVAVSGMFMTGMIVAIVSIMTCPVIGGMAVDSLEPVFLQPVFPLVSQLVVGDFHDLPFN